MDKLSGPVSVWVEKLSIPALPGLAVTFLRHGRFTLHFRSATRPGLAYAWLLNLIGVTVSKAKLSRNSSQGELRDDPQSAYYRIYAAVNEFNQNFFEKHKEVVAGLTYPDRRVKPERVSANLQNAAANTTYELLGLLEQARYQHRMDGVTPRRLVIISPYASLAEFAPSGWAGDEVEFTCPWNRHDSLILRLGRGILRSMADSLRPKQPSRSLAPSVAVEAVWPLNPEDRLNALFWWWESGIDPQRVILLFQRASHPASEAWVSRAEELGIRCVVLNRESVGDSPHLRWRAAPGASESIKRLFRNFQTMIWGMRNGRIGRWLACRAIDMMYNSDHRADFLTEYNVRAVLDHQEAGVDYLSLACDLAGATRIGFHWSYFPFPIANLIRLHQVYFAWGPQYAGVMQASGPCVDHVLLSGCIVRGAYPGGGDGQSGLVNRSLVTGQGASRVLTLFDTSTPCERLFEFFLRRLIQDPRWGLFIKPKTVNEELPWNRENLPQLRDLYEQALATGRVIMLDWRISPAEAASAADFSVGVDINSAVVVAALAGHRAIHLDYIHLPASPFSAWSDFHRAGEGRLIFADPEKLWEKLNRYLDEPGYDSELGVVDEELLQEIDPFRDGRAGQRIGEYIAWYLAGLDFGMERDAALGQATQRYAHKWGAKAKGYRPENRETVATINFYKNRCPV